MTPLHSRGECVCVGGGDKTVERIVDFRRTPRSPEVHNPLHCFERVRLRVIKTAPDNQLLNLLSVSRLVTILNDADQGDVVCKLQELDGGVFSCAVVRVERVELWGEKTALRSSIADRAGGG